MYDAQKVHGVQRRRQLLSRCRKRPLKIVPTIPLDRLGAISEQCFIRISGQVAGVYKRDACVQRIGVTGRKCGGKRERDAEIRHSIVCTMTQLL